MPKGIVQRYFDDIKMGKIQGPDQSLYNFRRSDWISSSEPKAGLKVTFDLDESRPVRIYVEE